MAQRKHQKQGLRVGVSPAETPADSADDTVIRDTLIPQLGRRQRGNHASWIVYLQQDGRVRKRTLGSCASLSVLQARRMAEDFLALSYGPQDLTAESLVAEVAVVFIEDCAGRWKPTTKRAHQHNIDHHILPAFGHRPIGDVARSDVAAWFTQMSGAKGAGNRALSVLSSLFAYAELTGLRPPDTNPCAGMRRHETSFKATYLDTADYARLGAAFDRQAKTHPLEVAFLRFCALTGCRRAEAVGLTWAMIDGKRAALPDAKAGPKSLWLARPVRKLLSNLPRQSAYVFNDGDRPITPSRIDRVWGAIRTSIGKPKLRIHDLRHSYASVAVSLGYDLLIVGGLLGHADKGATAGYAHLNSAEIAAATSRVGRHLAGVAGIETPLERAVSKPRIKANPHCAAFVRSKDSLSDFCNQRGLDPAAFRKELQVWRDHSRRAAR